MGEIESLNEWVSYLGVILTAISIILTVYQLSQESKKGTSYVSISIYEERYKNEIRNNQTEPNNILIVLLGLLLMFLLLSFNSIIIIIILLIGLISIFRSIIVARQERIKVGRVIVKHIILLLVLLSALYTPDFIIKYVQQLPDLYFSSFSALLTTVTSGLITIFKMGMDFNETWPIFIFVIMRIFTYTYMTSYFIKHTIKINIYKEAFNLLGRKYFLRMIILVILLLSLVFIHLYYGVFQIIIDAIVNWMV